RRSPPVGGERIVTRNLRVDVGEWAVDRAFRLHLEARDGRGPDRGFGGGLREPARQVRADAGITAPAAAAQRLRVEGRLVLAALREDEYAVAMRQHDFA